MTYVYVMFFFGYVMTYEHQMYDLRWYFQQSKCMSFYFLLCSANICTKDHIDICCDNSRTYLMIFLTNLGIDLMYRQTIKGPI